VQRSFFLLIGLLIAHFAWEVLNSDLNEVPFAIKMIGHATVGLVTGAVLMQFFLLTRRQLRSLNDAMMQRNDALERMRHEAEHDPLTQLPNRTVFMDRLARCIARHKSDPARRFAVLFLDIDRFKLINDSLGHNVGDLLLLDASKKILLCINAAFPGRKADDERAPMLARLGGDEFTILLPQISSLHEATALAKSIQAAMHSPFNFPGREVFTSASVGITTSDAGYSSSEEVLRDADTAMYRAKAAGRARYQVFDKAMHDVAISRLNIENDLRRALDHDELIVHYQPIVSLEDRKITGFEALLRWNHPKRGLVPPEEFIKVAEETGLIVPIGSWVLHEASRQMKHWLVRCPAYTNLTMSVNLSPKQLMDPELLTELDYTLRTTGLDPERLCLEITETMILENSEMMSPALSAIRERGVKLHMDDFGTGYSSLACLLRYPINAVKIDRSFISNFERHRDYAAVVHATVALAHNLGSEVVAEGVETAEQVAMLQAMDCDFAQGFYFYKARTPAEIESLLGAASEQLAHAA